MTVMSRYGGVLDPHHSLFCSSFSAPNTPRQLPGNFPAYVLITMRFSTCILFLLSAVLLTSVAAVPSIHGE